MILRSACFVYSFGAFTLNFFWPIAITKPYLSNPPELFYHGQKKFKVNHRVNAPELYLAVPLLFSPSAPEMPLIIFDDKIVTGGQKVYMAFVEWSYAWTDIQACLKL